MFWVSKPLIGMLHATPLDEVRTIRNATELSVLVGSRLHGDNVADTMAVCDSAIVKSAFKSGNDWLDPVKITKVLEQLPR